MSRKWRKKSHVLFQKRGAFVDLVQQLRKRVGHDGHGRGVQFLEDSFDPDEVVQLLGQLEKTKGFNRNI